MEENAYIIVRMEFSLQKKKITEIKKNCVLSFYFINESMKKKNKERATYKVTRIERKIFKW